MSKIQGINSDMVKRYGRYLMKLIRTTEQGYHSMCDQEDRPYDPNHQHVVVISDDEENNEDREFDDLEGELASQEERSAYFEPPAEVEAFNAERRSQLIVVVGNILKLLLVARVQTIRPMSQDPQESRSGKAARGGSRWARKGSYKNNRKFPGGSNKGKASNDGGKKKAFGGRSNSGGFGGGAASSKGGHNTSGSARGGLGMMPT